VNCPQCGISEFCLLDVDLKDPVKTLIFINYIQIIGKDVL